MYGEQLVPSVTGFSSITGKKPTNLTTIDYYPVINHPITDYQTVQECLKYAEDATGEVGQDCYHNIRSWSVHEGISNHME